jgi:hypothetical protein
LTLKSLGRCDISYPGGIDNYLGLFATALPEGDARMGCNALHDVVMTLSTLSTAALSQLPSFDLTDPWSASRSGSANRQIALIAVILCALHCAEHGHGLGRSQGRVCPIC